MHDQEPQGGQQLDTGAALRAARPGPRARTARTKASLASQQRAREIDRLADPDEVSNYVHYAQKAFVEAHSLAKENRLPDQQAFDLAVQAWKNCLPVLSSRLAVRAYIALTAQGMARQWLDPEESRAMMYTAQTALAVLGKGGAK